MHNVTLGSTGITVPQNAFGALPIQRISTEAAVALVRRAYEGGMRFFDTARAYTDSEEKLGIAFAGMRERVYIATKTAATTGDGVREQLATSLEKLQTSYVDLYQLHNVARCYRPGDGTGVYEALLEAKEQGLIRHIGVTAHKIKVAFECVESGLYETMQFPFSYLTGERELELLKACERANMGFIVMKGLAGGLITRSDAAMAFMTQHPWALPIWGIQRESELDEWLSYMDNTPEMTPELEEYIARERAELSGEFCRGCGYCMPCPMKIQINNCARMSLMVRRAPSEAWLNDYWQTEMARIDTCINCYLCESRCPYELETPALLRKNLADYRRILAGEIEV